mmetsp:Transcript_66060/g.141344  ORF Transcript_66060/g.141344 Transcript_66060/m.141344 type:complete len:117 (-) Transcript_66060:754-1104(-)
MSCSPASFYYIPDCSSSAASVAKWIQKMRVSISAYSTLAHCSAAASAAKWIQKIRATVSVYSTLAHGSGIASARRRLHLWRPFAFPSAQAQLRHRAIHQQRCVPGRIVGLGHLREI